MTTETLTQKERRILSAYWGMSIRIRNGNVEMKKRNCWGILCSIKVAKENAQILIKREWVKPC